MLEHGTGDVTLVFNGVNNADVKQYTVGGLNTGNYYSFFVEALNFNTVSEYSKELVVSVCLAPTHIDSPTKEATTESSISLVWTTPEFLGGCPTLGFALFMDDGVSDFTEVDSEQIRNKPYLNSHTVSGLTLLGSTYKF